MITISEKLKNTKPTMVDPLASELMTELAENVEGYTFYSSYIFGAKNAGMVFEEFISLFLHSYAYIGDKEGNRLPSYDPFHIAYSERFVHPEHGASRKWVGWWTNCWIMYTEYVEHPERNVVLLAVDKETFDGAIKMLEQTPNGE